jgi:hypothetical protein
MIAGLYFPRIGAKWAGASGLVGLIILTASKLGMLDSILSAGFPGYLAGFIAGSLLVGVATIVPKGRISS